MSSPRQRDSPYRKEEWPRSPRTKPRGGRRVKEDDTRYSPFFLRRKLQKYSEFARSISSKVYSFLIAFSTLASPQGLRPAPSFGWFLFCVAGDSKISRPYVLNDAWRKHGGFWEFGCCLWPWCFVVYDKDRSCVVFRSNHILLPEDFSFLISFDQCKGRAYTQRQRQKYTSR